MARTAQNRNFRPIRLITGSETLWDEAGKKLAPNKHTQATYKGMDILIDAVIPGDGKTLTLKVSGTDIGETLHAPGYIRFDVDNLDVQVEGYGSSLPADQVIQGQAARYVSLGKFKTLAEGIEALTPKVEGETPKQTAGK